mmetsp:Transcript_23310/g.31842  ORF Transcript_23310/g.31842 Transcript_23310/m.31842 type:complete len:235 (-) Transcript_23310:344-1048(-)
MTSIADSVREWHHGFTRSIHIRYERLTAHHRVQSFIRHPTVQSVWKFYQEKKIFDIFCRFLIVSYFLNMAYYNLDIYYNYNFSGKESISFFTLSRVPFALAYLFNYRVNVTGTALCIFSGFDSLMIFSNQFRSGHYVVTELIVKKLAIFGSCLLLVVELFKGKINFSAGVIDPDAGTQKNNEAVRFNFDLSPYDLFSFLVHWSCRNRSPDSNNWALVFCLFDRKSIPKARRRWS